VCVSYSEFFGWEINGDNPSKDPEGHVIGVVKPLM
jgi:hypothetical protein